jgi:hypothetical protein
MTVKGIYPSSAPSLDLNFGKLKRLDPRITFTRASLGTYVDLDGLVKTATTNTARFDHNPTAKTSLGLLIEEARTNQIFYSNIGFSEVNVQRYAGVAPDGTYTAALVTSQNISPGNYLTPGVGTFTYSVYVKQGTSSTFSLTYAGYGGTDWVFTFSTETLVLLGAWSNGIVQKFPNGWYRLSATTSSRSLYYYGFSTDAATSNVYFWGHQLEAGAFPTSYVPTPITFTSRGSTAAYYDASGILQTASSNVARNNAFFPDGGGAMRSAGLLLEAAGTNLVTYSEQFNNASWTKSNATVSANAIAAPDGTTTAELIYPTTTGSLRYVYKSASISSGVTTMSFFAKSAGMTRCYLAGGTTSIAGWFDLSAGTVGTVTAGCTASIERLSNGWNRCSLSQPISATPYASIGPCDADNSFVATTSATNGIYVWGGQLETGSFSTSYIATTTATITRSADVSSSATATRATDVASLTGANFTSWYDQNGGTVFCQAISNSTENSSYWTLQGSASNGATLLVYPANSLTYQVQDAGVLQVNDVGFATYPSVKSFKTATVVRLNDFAVVSSGTTITTDLAGTVPPATSFLIGKYLGGGGSYSYSGTIARIAYYPLRLSNAQLFALTQ